MSPAVNETTKTAMAQSALFQTVPIWTVGSANAEMNNQTARIVFTNRAAGARIARSENATTRMPTIQVFVRWDAVWSQRNAEMKSRHPE